MKSKSIGRSIECRFCGCRMNEVTHTWVFDVTYHGKKRTIIKRRRVCRHCKLPYTTIETYEDEENSKLPEDVLPFQPPPPPTGVYYPPTMPLAESNGEVAALQEPSRPCKQDLAASPLPPKKGRPARKRN